MKTVRVVVIFDLPAEDVRTPAGIARDVAMRLAGTMSNFTVTTPSITGKSA